MADLLDQVLALVREHGWYVFRLKISHDEAKCDGGTANCKRFDFPDEHWSVTSTNDPDVIAGWDWSDVNAYGIDCGKSGLVVVDQDPGDTWPFNGTRVHSTGRGKHHIYEDLLGLGCKVGLSPWGIDVRGVGGVSVGPGSWHPHGAYAVLEDVAVIPEPGELITAVRAARTAEYTGPSYDGPGYEDLDEQQRAEADLYLLRQEDIWRARFAGALEWPEGKRDDAGHGWEVLARNWAWTCARLAVTPWVRLDGAGAEALFGKVLPEAIADDPVCAGKWRHNLVARAARKPIEPPPWAASAFFDRTPVLAHIRRAAHSRGIGAWSVLASLLAHTALRIPVGADLPPVVGAEAPLNAGFALVGDSGSSKSASETVATELLGAITREDWTRPLGSGEGMIDAYYEMLPTGPRGKYEAHLVAMRSRRRLFVTDEGESLRKLTERASGTLGGFLRTALTGGMLGTGNSLRAGNDRKVPKGKYRLVMIIGIHPDQSDVLLDGEGTGLPQRFCWMPADDASLPEDQADLPAWPGRLDVTMPLMAPGLLDYPDHIKAEVRQRNLDRRRGGRHRRRAHATLTQLKLAQLLAVLHGESVITDQWWALAAELSDLSLALQDQCEARLGEVRQRAHNVVTVAKDRAEDAADTDRVKRVGATILRKLQDAQGEWVGWSPLRRGIAHRLRSHAESALEALVTAGQVEVEEYVNEKGSDSRRLRHVRGVEV